MSLHAIIDAKIRTRATHGDLAFHFEEPFAQHVKAEDARRQGDADDVVRYTRCHKGHKPFRDQQAHEEVQPIDDLCGRQRVS